MSYKNFLLKISNKTVKIGIVGLGYVGLPLSVSFAKNGITVLGFDKKIQKINSVNSANNYIPDIPDSELRDVVLKTKKLSATNDFYRIKECDAVIICVPTPLDKFKKPNMSFIETSCIEIGKNINSGTLISLESTTYPTTTEDFIKPIIERESGLKEGIDFWLCFSPERIDPGNKNFNVNNTPKVIGGLGREASEIASALYSITIKNIHTVSSPRVAEMVKILENTYRLVNISLINELALLAGKMNIDIWEVIEAAKTKPYGFQPFYPGPGIGGHCIPLDPFYLEHIAKIFNFELSMIHTAGSINERMPHRMMNKISFALNRQKKSLNGSKILFMGIAYKPDINDARESPAISILEQLAKKGAKIYYHDPYIAKIEDNNGNLYFSSILTNDLLSEMDCVVLSTNHSCFDSKQILENSKLIVDLRNIIKNVSIEDGKVYKL